MTRQPANETTERHSAASLHHWQPTKADDGNRLADPRRTDGRGTISTSILIGAGAIRQNADRSYGTWLAVSRSAIAMCSLAAVRFRWPMPPPRARRWLAAPLIPSAGLVVDAVAGR